MTTDDYYWWLRTCWYLYSLHCVTYPDYLGVAFAVWHTPYRCWWCWEPYWLLDLDMLLGQKWFCHSGLIEVVPGLELWSPVIDFEIVWCRSNLWKAKGGAQDPFITDTMTNTVRYNLQQCSILWHGVVGQIRYVLNSDLVWHRVDGDQIWISAEYNTSVRVMWDAWTDLLGQMIYYGLHQQSYVYVSSHIYMPGLDGILMLNFPMDWIQIGVNFITFWVSLGQGDSAPFALGGGVAFEVCNTKHQCWYWELYEWMLDFNMSLG